MWVLSDVLAIPERAVLSACISYLIFTVVLLRRQSSSSSSFPSHSHLNQRSRSFRTWFDMATEWLHIPTIDISAIIRFEQPAGRTTQFPTYMIPQEGRPWWAKCQKRPVFLPSSTTCSRGQRNDQGTAELRSRMLGSGKQVHQGRASVLDRTSLVSGILRDHASFP